MFFKKLFKKQDVLQEGRTLIQEMKDVLSIFMAKYAIKNPDSMENLSEVFANAQLMINSISPEDAKKEMLKNGVPAECGVLNIIQNFAMCEIQSSPKNFFFGQNDAFDLYTDINDEKLKKGYISKEQYEENKRLGTCLKMGIRPL